MNHSFSLNDWSKLLPLFGGADSLDASARASGALVRRRAVRDGATLLRLGLGYGPGGLSLREAAAWAGVQGISTLSDVALLKRLRGAADWFASLAGQALARRSGLSGKGVRPLRLVDGTAINGPGNYGKDWRLHVAYDPVAQCFTAIELTDGREAEKLDRFKADDGEIRIADRGFGSRPDCIAAISEGPGDYVVRVHWRGLRWQDNFGGRFDILDFLRGLEDEEIGETKIMIGRGKGRSLKSPVPARLIAVRLPPEKVEVGRTRIQRDNRRKGRSVQPGTLEAASHILLLTSLTEAEYPAKEIAALYRLRWQVELAFKRMKSLFDLDKLRAKDPRLAKAWIFANLLTVLLVEDITRQLPDSSP
ncbi:IS4 family transposase [Agrobacterium sp. MCAB5]|uniref:IS4 family transposase n=1 Tax=Agrobacterium sp. MCAB5 TaxID=3233042 RepID=UPI003F91D830